MGKRVILLALAMALVAAAPAPASELTVKRERAVVMEKPQFWAKTLDEVKRDQKVRVLDEAAYPWLRVSVRGREGFLHASAFESKRVSLSAAADSDQSYEVSSNRSVNLAARGFDQGTESSYRASKPELERAFKVLDAYEVADAKGPSDDELRKFAADGALKPSGAEAVAEGGAR